MRGSTVILLFALTLLSLAQNNYQERAIYLEDIDNPCRQIGHRELINMEIHVDWKPTIRGVAESTTVCIPDVIVPEQALHPSTRFTFVLPSLEHQVSFIDEPRYVTQQGILYRIIEKTTIGDYVKIYNREDYNCSIVGDGKVQHWGVDFEYYEPATIVMNCVDPLPASIQNLETQTQ